MWYAASLANAVDFGIPAQREKLACPDKAGEVIGIHNNGDNADGLETGFIKNQNSWRYQGGNQNQSAADGSIDCLHHGSPRRQVGEKLFMQVYSSHWHRPNQWCDTLASATSTRARIFSRQQSSPFERK